METQNREIIQLFEGSNEANLQLTTAQTAAPLDQPLQLKLSMPGARAIAVLCNRRIAGRVSGEQGTLTVDPRGLGLGTVELQPVAVMPPGREVGGAPVEVHIVAPAPWPAQTPPDKLQPGLRLQAGSQAPVVMAKLDPDALAQAGAKAFEQFQIDAWFSAPADDLYQFQMRVPAGQVTLRVDGKDLGHITEGAWAYLPVSLQKGWHSVTVVGVPEPPVGLEVNFGGEGTWPLAGPGFQCVGP
jgi:hypothetical protein